MKKQTKPTIRMIKLLVLLPVIGLVIYGFSEKKSVEVEKDPGTESESIENSKELDFHLKIGGGIMYEGKVYAISDLKDLLKDSDNNVLVNLSVDPGVPMGQLADFQTELRKLDVRKIKYVNNSAIWPPSNERMNDLTEYLNDLQVYFEKLESGVHFIRKPESEQEEIIKVFLDIAGRYSRLSIDDKKKTRLPVHPYWPYTRLEKDGKVFYKMMEDMSDEEKEKFPPPPPPSVGGNRVTMLNVYQDLYFAYELVRNEKKHYIYKSKVEQDAIMKQFQKVESAYFGLDYEVKMLVKRPTNPQAPYVKLSKDGKEFFKLSSELNEEDRKLMIGC